MTKKFLIIAFVLMCLVGLVACDPTPNSVDKSELLENTVKIEIYDYENIKPKQLNLGGKKKPIFDFSKASFIGTLDEETFEDVIKDIARQEFLIFGETLNEPIGKTIILYQENGNMVVLFGCVYESQIGSEKYYGEGNIFDENGVFVEHIGYIDSHYVDFLESKYFANGN